LTPTSVASVHAPGVPPLELDELDELVWPDEVEELDEVVEPEELVEPEEELLEVEAPVPELEEVLDAVVPSPPAPFVPEEVVALLLPQAISAATGTTRRNRATLVRAMAWDQPS